MTEPSNPEIPFCRVLLVGFMGAGKSAVGAALAADLRWDFRDFDTHIAARLGLPVGRIFEEFGEEGFRTIEDRVAAELLGMDRAVLASGGGWPCEPGRMEEIGDRTLSVWLRVSPELAVERCRKQDGTRPLLEALGDSDVAAAAEALLARRRPYYEQARWTLDSSTAEPELLAERLANQIRTNPERPIRE